MFRVAEGVSKQTIEALTNLQTKDYTRRWITKFFRIQTHRLAWFRSHHERYCNHIHSSDGSVLGCHVIVSMPFRFTCLSEKQQYFWCLLTVWALLECHHSEAHVILNISIRGIQWMIQYATIHCSGAYLSTVSMQICINVVWILHASSAAKGNPYTRPCEGCHGAQ